MGGGEGRSHTLQLRLWTDRGEVALSMTASVIGPEHEKQRPVAIYGQGKWRCGREVVRSCVCESGDCVPAAPVLWLGALGRTRSLPRFTESYSILSIK